jgi:hypothetical protein
MASSSPSEGQHSSAATDNLPLAKGISPQVECIVRALT